MAVHPTVHPVVTIVIPAVPASCLLPNAARRTDWHVKAKASRELRIAAGWAARAAGGRVVGPVCLSVTVRWPPGRRRVDVDGLALGCKALLDGIVDGGAIDGDGPAVVVEASYRQERTTGAGETEITVRECR